MRSRVPLRTTRHEAAVGTQTVHLFAAAMTMTVMVCSSIGIGEHGHLESI